MGIIKQKQIEEMEKEEERAREHKIQMLKNNQVDEDIFNLTNNMCQGGCQNYLTVEEDGWGICFDCRVEKND